MSIINHTVNNKYSHYNIGLNYCVLDTCQEICCHKLSNCKMPINYVSSRTC